MASARSKTKLFKYQEINAKEKFIRDQTQNSGIYQRSKSYLGLNFFKIFFCYFPIWTHVFKNKWRLHAMVDAKVKMNYKMWKRKVKKYKGYEIELRGYGDDYANNLHATWDII